MRMQVACSAETPWSTISSWSQDLWLVGLGSVLLAFCAPVSVQLPFTPVPLALAPQIALVLGAVCGSRRGALAVLVYLLQGAIGLPVFALGDGGVLHLLGPRGGYLIGYAVGAYVTGYLMDKIVSSRTPCSTFLAFVAGNSVILFLGMCQLSLFVGCKAAILLGVLPFLPGEFVKLFMAHTMIRRFL